jgi:histidinol-phosphate aminotransferase
MCFRAFAAAGDTVAFPSPTYPVLEPLCAIHETRVSAHPLDGDWRLPPALASDPAPLKFVVNPNSPTGTWYRRHEVEPVVAGSAGVVVLDEAYVDFAPEPRLDLLAGHDNLLILRTFSKSHALAGLRIGFALGHPDLIAALDLVKESYNVDRLAIAAAVAAIEDEHHHRALVRAVVEDRDWLTAQLAALGFDVEPPAANFVFSRPPAGVPAATIAERLRARRVLVRHYSQPRLKDWLRITVGRRDELQVLVEALGEIVAGEAA